MHCQVIKDAKYYPEVTSAHCHQGLDKHGFSVCLGASVEQAGTIGADKFALFLNKMTKGNLGGVGLGKCLQPGISRETKQYQQVRPSKSAIYSPHIPPDQQWD